MNNKINPCTTNMGFKANISKRFLDAADVTYTKLGNNNEYTKFCNAIRRFIQMPNTDNITIDFYKYSDSKNNKYYSLIANDSKSNNRVILSTKDKFRKLLTKFTFMNEYEFKIKMGIIKNR